MSGPKEQEDTKTLAAAIAVDLYWQFKKVAASRQESMKQALENAAKLYIDADTNEKGGNN